MPEWFTERFPAQYHRKRLFDEIPADPLHAGPFENRAGAPWVSEAERALLEVSSEVGVRQPLQEARELAESAYNLRADVLRDMLMRCSSVKTVRLCLHFGRELSLPWAAKRDSAWWAADHLHGPGRVVAPSADADACRAAESGGKESRRPPEQALGRERLVEVAGRVQHVHHAFHVPVRGCQCAYIQAQPARDG